MEKCTEDILIKQMAYVWDCPQPRTLKELAEFIEVVTHNVALRQDIFLDKVKLELENDEDIVRIGFNDSLEHMENMVREWNASNQGKGKGD